MMRGFRLRHPATDFLITFLRARVEHARKQEDRGASAIEWVVIAAVVVTVVAAVGYVISQALNDRADDVGECITGTDGTSENCGNG
jgi:Flp pilus assembly pilin Flp